MEKENREVSELVNNQAKIEELAENIFVLKGYMLKHEQMISANSKALTALKRNNAQNNVYMMWGDLFLRKSKASAVESINRMQSDCIKEVDEFEEKMRQHATELELLEKGNIDHLKGHNLLPLTKDDLSYIKY